MGRNIYFTKDEIDALCDFFNNFEEISTDEETYAYWLKRIGSVGYKVFGARGKNKTVKVTDTN